MKRRARIYVAGPLTGMTGDYWRNIRNMLLCAERVREKGYSVYIPGLDVLVGIMFPECDGAAMFENSQPWLDASDAMFLCPGWEKSVGTLRELDRAAQRRIPHYCDIDKLAADVPAEIDDDE